MNGTIEFKAKFWGTSIGAVLEGYATLDLFRFNERYRFTFPTAVAKGYFFPPITMEYDGKCKFQKDGSDLHGLLQFKLKPFFGGEPNHMYGELSAGSDLLYTITGQFDKLLMLNNQQTKQSSTFWRPSAQLEHKMPQRFTVPLEQQGPFESQKMWNATSTALLAGDQEAAMDEKDKLEVQQRKDKSEREEKGKEWEPVYFLPSAEDPTHFLYKYANNTLIDADKEEEDIEYDYKITTVPKIEPPLLCEKKIREKNATELTKVWLFIILMFIFQGKHRNTTSTPHRDPH
jgi:hypothetical protein